MQKVTGSTPVTSTKNLFIERGHPERSRDGLHKKQLAYLRAFFICKSWSITDLKLSNKGFYVTPLKTKEKNGNKGYLPSENQN